MPRARTGLNVVTKKRPDSTTETYFYHLATGAQLGTSSGGMTREKAILLIRATEQETPRQGPRVGSFDWLAVSYLASPRLARKAPRTAKGYRKRLDWLRERWGTRNAEGIRRADVARVLADLSHAPFQANATVRVVRLLYSWGRKELGVQGENPALAPELHPTRPRTQIWDEPRIAAFLAAAPEDMRLAMALLLYTVQRPSDVLAMTSTQVGERNGRLWLWLRQAKTGELVAAPCHRTLALPLRARLAEMDAAQARAERGEAVEGREATLLLVPGPGGEEWRYRSFAAAWDRTRRLANLRLARDIMRGQGGLPPRANAPARAAAKKALRGRLLTGLQRRDLRRTGMVMMALAGATTIQIAGLSGHSIDSTTKILETYLPRRGEVAEQGVKLWEAGGRQLMPLLPQARGK